jgi:hypothetical protein
MFPPVGEGRKMPNLVSPLEEANAVSSNNFFKIPCDGLKPQTH